MEQNIPPQELRSILITSKDSQEFNLNLKSLLSKISPENYVDTKFSTSNFGVQNTVEYSAIVIFLI